MVKGEPNERSTVLQSHVADDLGLGTIEVPRAAEVLADRLRSRILAGQVPIGTWLPTERELADQSRLSRESVRDALRTLEFEGLVETRQGRSGGTLVRRPDPSSIHRILEAFIRGRRIRFRSLLEIRELVEPACAGWAAQRRDDDDLTRLDDLSRSLRAQIAELPLFLTLNTEWHMAVAEASHNELLTAFMSAISEEIRAGTDIQGLNTDEIVRRALAAHDRILRAIRARDAEGAHVAMRQHVCAYRNTVAGRQQLDVSVPLRNHDGRG